MEKIRILIVEDEAIVATNIQTKLEKAGYEVVGIAYNGKDAEKLVVEKNPDLILLDIKLQAGESGIETAEKIKSRKDLPIIYLTSYTDEETFEKAKLTEPAAFLAKPLIIDDLSRIIHLTLYNHKIKRELLETKKRYELAVQAGKTGVWEYIPSQRKTIIDSGFLNLFGLKSVDNSEEADSWIDFVPMEDLELINSKFQELIEGKSEHYSVEHRIKRADGTTGWVISSGRFVKGDKLNPDKIIGTLTDITNLKSAEKKLKQYSSELRKSNLAKDNFFSIIAHDLRNPFHTILGASELLANYSDQMSQEEIRETALNIYRSASNVYNLLVNLLEWSRFQTGKIEVNKVQFDLCEIVEQVIELYSDTLKNKNQLLTNNFDKNCYVFADKYMIESVVRNLISNAIKFTPPGGKIELSCKNIDEDRVEFSVKDNGIGISQEIQQKLFQLDAHISTKGTEQEKGTGLGLILCKDFIEKNDGTISFESEAGKGSLFRITVPKN